MVVCSHCGHNNQDGIRFCAACGSFLEWTGTEPSPQTSALAVRLAPADLSVDPGGQASSEVRVRNTGSIVDEFVLEVTGEAAAWSAVQPASLRLFPEKEEVAQVVFRPPRSPEVRAGRKTFGVRVSSSVAGSGVVEEKQGSVVVGEFFQLEATITPQTSEGIDSAEHTLMVHNRGNTKATVEVEAADKDERLAFELDPPRHEIEPGASGVSRIRVTRRQRSSRREQILPFQVSLEPAGGTAIVLEGAMRQLAPPSAPSARRGYGWILALIALALAVLGAITVASGRLSGLLGGGGPTPVISPSPVAASPSAEPSPSPPPSPSPSPTRSPSAAPSPTATGTTRLESEAQTFTSNVPGNVIRQNNCCGVLWSGNQQLFFQGKQPGHYLTVRFTVPIGGTFLVQARLTKAPDYGTYAIQLDGNTVLSNYDLYNTTVSVSLVTLSSRTQLSAGSHSLTLTAIGKDAKSTNYFAGLDYLDLTAVP